MQDQAGLEIDLPQVRTAAISRDQNPLINARLTSTCPALEQVPYLLPVKGKHNFASRSVKVLFEVWAR